MDNAHNRRAEDRRAPGALQWGEAASGAALAGAEQSSLERFGYVITPRAPHVGGGWRLQMLEDGQEVGCSLHPAASQAETDDAYQEAMEDGEAWLLSRGAADTGETPACFNSLGIAKTWMGPSFRSLRKRCAHAGSIWSRSLAPAQSRQALRSPTKTSRPSGKPCRAGRPAG
jgi:hypothetical protein